jgi:hypothetical protein
MPSVTDLQKTEVDFEVSEKSEKFSECLHSLWDYNSSFCSSDFELPYSENQSENDRLVIEKSSKQKRNGLIFFVTDLHVFCTFLAELHHLRISVKNRFQVSKTNRE